MNKYEIPESNEEQSNTLIKKIITWIIVLSITIMLLLMLISQPRFFTYIK